MVRLTRNVITSAVIYTLLVLVSLFLGSVSERLAYFFLFLSSLLFSATIIYETWKSSKPLNEIKHPNWNDALNQKELQQLTASIEKAVSDKSCWPQVISHLREILLKTISLRLGVELNEAENLSKNRKKLMELGYDRFSSLLTEGSSVPPTRSERIRTLNDILDQLEETD